jgi:hypothetical protein
MQAFLVPRAVKSSLTVMQQIHIAAMAMTPIPTRDMAPSMDRLRSPLSIASSLIPGPGQGPAPGLVRVRLQSKYCASRVVTESLNGFRELC